MLVERRRITTSSAPSSASSLNEAEPSIVTMEDASSDKSYASRVRIFVDSTQPCEGAESHSYMIICVL